MLWIAAVIGLSGLSDPPSARAAPAAAAWLASCLPDSLAKHLVVRSRATDLKKIAAENPELNRRLEKLFDAVEQDRAWNQRSRELLVHQGRLRWPGRRLGAGQEGTAFKVRDRDVVLKRFIQPEWAAVHLKVFRTLERYGVATPRVYDSDLKRGVLEVEYVRGFSHMEFEMLRSSGLVTEDELRQLDDGAIATSLAISRFWQDNLRDGIEHDFEVNPSMLRLIYDPRRQRWVSVDPY